MKIFENNYKPETIKNNNLTDLGNIICPNCDSKLYVEAKDVYYKNFWHNGIVGPGSRGGSSILFKCPCCEYHVNGANAKKWVETSDGELIAEEDVTCFRLKKHVIDFGSTTMFDD